MNSSEEDPLEKCVRSLGGVCELTDSATPGTPNCAVPVLALLESSIAVGQRVPAGQADTADNLREEV